MPVTTLTGAWMRRQETSEHLPLFHRLPAVMFWMAVSFCALMVAAGCRGPLDDPASHRGGLPAPARDRGDDAAAYYYFAAAQMKIKSGGLDEARWYLEQAIDRDPEGVLPRLELAGLYMAHQQSEQAMALIQEVLADRPNHPDALIMAGRIYQQNRMLEAAKDVYEKVLALGVDDPDPYMHLGGIYWDADDPANAARVFGMMVERFPHAYAAHYFQGKALLAQGELDAAAQAFKRSLALEPSLEEPYLELIHIYKIQGDADQVVHTYQTLLAYHPDNSGALLDLAAFHHGEGASEQGRRLLLELGRQVESNPAALGHLYERYYEQGAYEITAWAVTGMLEAAPENSDLHYLAGLVNDQLNDSSTALAHLSRVQPQSRFYGSAVIHRAMLLNDADRTEEAIAAIQQGLRHDQRNAAFHFYLGAFYEAGGRYAEALEALRAAVAIDDSNARYHFRMGVVYDKMNRPEDVIDAMQKSLAIAPEDAETLNYLGYTYAELGIALEEAEALIKKALRIKPDDGYITDSLAWVYYKMGRYQEALEWIVKAVHLVPDDPTILEHMGDIHRGLADKEQALEAYRRSLELKTEGHDALREKIRELQTPQQPPKGSP